MTRRNTRASFRRAVLNWHRRIGLVSLLLIAIVSLTGLALNHNQALNLDGRTLNSEFLMSWYGLALQGDPIHFSVGRNFISFFAGSVFLDENIVDESSQPLIGAVRVRDKIVFATRTNIVFIDGDQLVSRRFDEHEIPGAIEVIGTSDRNTLVVRSTTGAFILNKEAAWLPFAGKANWSAVTNAPNNLKRSIAARYEKQGLPLGRILLDLHSGRIFGNWGPYLMDAAALCLLILAISGFYNWYASRR